jgi:predicted SAM-dependent methyltransferase
MATRAGSQPTEEASGAPTRRLNWGCGEHVLPGWINSDIKPGPGVDLACDIREGLLLEDSTIDYVVSIHALPELPYPDLLPALEELRRVLRPGGVLRLALPDLDRGIRAYLDHEGDYFLVDPDEARSRGGRFIAHILWYGYSRSLFTFDFTEELLQKSGFVNIVRCDYRRTSSRFPEIVELDNRERESFYVEARNQE